MLESDGLVAGGECSSASVGNYNLPKHLIGVSIKLEESPVRSRHQLYIQRKANSSPSVAEIKVVEDRQKSYCLDFAESVLSEDHIAVSKVVGTNLLAQIRGDSEDKTPDTVNKLIDAAGEVAALLKTRDGTQAGVDAATVLELTWFDPFDQRQMSVLNREIKQYGYCVFLSDLNDPFVPAWSPEMCGIGNAEVHASSPSARVAAVPSKGVYYRPMLTHRLVVAKRADPDIGPFVVESMISVQMANAAPTLAVEVSRSLFVKRETSLDFEDGVLKNVSIAKPSELNAFINIPLKLVGVVVSIPVRALTISTNEAKNQKALIVAQNELIFTLSQYEKTKREYETATAGASSGDGLYGGGGTKSGDRLSDEERAARYSECLDGYARGLEGAEELCREAVDREE